jgi:hypothetical protein
MTNLQEQYDNRIYDIFTNYGFDILLLYACSYNSIYKFNLQFDCTKIASLRQLGIETHIILKAHTYLKNLGSYSVDYKNLVMERLKISVKNIAEEILLIKLN